MPQAAPIVLNDGTTDKTFYPNNKDKNGVFHLLDDSLGQADLTNHLSLSAVKSNTATGKSTLKLEVISPKIDADTGISFSNGKCIFEVTAKYPSNFTVAERTAAFAMLKASLNNTSVAEVIRDVRPVY